MQSRYILKYEYICIKIKKIEVNIFQPIFIMNLKYLNQYLIPYIILKCVNVLRDVHMY